MIFILPLLFFIFICLLILKLAGGLVSWSLVFLPLILAVLFFVLMIALGKKFKNKSKKKLRAD